METQDETLDTSVIRRFVHATSNDVHRSGHPSESAGLIAPSSLQRCILPPSRSKPNAAQPVPTPDVRHGRKRRSISPIKHFPIGQHKHASTAPAVTDSESLLFLASTVAETPNVQQIISNPANINAAKLQGTIKRNMATQGSLPEDTQPVSQSLYEELRSRNSRSIWNTDRFSQYMAHDELAVGCEEDDSIFRVDPAARVAAVPDENEAAVMDKPSNSQITDFTPTQTQKRLSQYPQSQRFKTPAVAGRKRRHTGDAVATPGLPLNPIGKIYDSNNNSGIMGISQAFDMTQAPSSPVPIGVRSDPLRSDIPSPAVALETLGPVRTFPIANTSSPLVPRSAMKMLEMAGPLPMYVSAKQSQNKRLWSGSPNEAQITNDKPHSSQPGDNDDEDFEQSSLVDRLRRQRAREMEVNARFRATFSSPPTRADIEPNIASKADATAPDLSRLGSSPHLSINNDVQDETEAETDQEDEPQLPEETGEFSGLVDEEDKENYDKSSLQVPHTTARARRLHDEAPQIESSPTSRFTELMPAKLAHSNITSPTFAIADSQQPLSSSQQTGNGRLKSSNGGNTIVSQSQQERAKATPPVPGHRKSQEPANNLQTFRTQYMEHAQDQAANLKDLLRRADSSSRLSHPPGLAPPNGTIPETNLSMQEDKLNKHRALAYDNRELAEDSESRLSTYETALTHQKPSLGSIVGNQKNPTTILAFSPSGRKRKRMTEIVSHASQSESQELDIDAAMNVVDDDGFASIMNSSSPIAPGRYSRQQRAKPAYQSSPWPTAGLPALARQQQAQHLDRSLPEGTHPEIENTCSSPLRGLNDRKLENDMDEAGSSSPFGRSLSVPIQRKRLQAASRDIWETPASPEATRIQSKSPQSLKSAHLRKPLPKSRKFQKSSALPQPSRHDDRCNEVVAIVESTTVDSPTDNNVKSAEKTLFPNQVLACFNGKSRAYYPATCLGIIPASDPRRYEIQWDGYEPDTIDEYGLRQFDLRVGDAVKVDYKGFPKVSHIVRGFKDKVRPERSEHVVTDIRGYRTILLAPKQRKSLLARLSSTETATREVPMSAIYLDSNMWNQLKDRLYDFVSPLSTSADGLPYLASGIQTPSERPSTPDTPTSRNRRLFSSTAHPPTSKFDFAPRTTGSLSNMAFAISYVDVPRRDTLASLIAKNGGYIVAEGFQELFANPEDDERNLELKQSFDKLGFVALLADRHNRRPKFLQALALNIPCLSGKWLEAFLNADSATNVSWRDYLLPAGESAFLEGAARSRTILTPPDLALISTLPSLKDLFANRSIFLKDELVILITGRGKVETKRKPVAFFLRAVAAGKVVKVVDARAAKDMIEQEAAKEHGQRSIWVFVDDKETGSVKKSLRSTEFGSCHVRVASNEELWQSLILGRLFKPDG